MRFLPIVFLLVSCPLLAQAGSAKANAVGPSTRALPPDKTLKETVTALAGEANATVAVACGLSTGTIDCDVNPDNHPPMQSVFKLPLAITVLHQVEQGRFTLDQPVRFLPSDRILPSVYSPLQTAHPEANVDVPLRDLLQGTVTLSDNVAADILLRLIGGPAVVQAYIESLGVKDFHLVDGEDGLHADQQFQFRNWMSPRAAVTLLLRLVKDSPLNAADTQALFGWMQGAPATAGRIKAGVPAGTVVRHKSGTSDAVLGLAYATNDIALVTLPDGRFLAIAVFLTNSTDDADTRDATIAKIAKASYDAAVGH